MTDPGTSGAPCHIDGRFRIDHEKHPHVGVSAPRFLRDPRRPGRTRPDYPKAPNHPARLAANRSVTSLTWIGRASFLVQLGGIIILTDPVVSRRTSPTLVRGLNFFRHGTRTP